MKLRSPVELIIQGLKNMVLVALVFAMKCSFAQNSSLQTKVEQIVKGKDLTIGVAVYSESGQELVNINGDRRFAMQSVYKLPIAMAYLEGGSMECFSDSITISKSELLPNTWSPFAEAHPQGARVSVEEFVEYVVAGSDNNLCDVMIDLSGGVAAVDAHLRGLGVSDIAVRNYEREIQASWETRFENCASANAVVGLLKRLWIQRQQGSQTSELLWQIMHTTKTGSPRDLLLPTTQIGYKTGFSGKSTAGITAANNCVGIIENPQSEDIFFAIFISESSEDEKINYSIISQIIKALE